MSRVTIDDRLPAFKMKLRNAYDDALGETAKDALIDAKNHAPYAKGGLRREASAEQVVSLKWRISFWIEYARFQEFGGDSRRRVRNYTTAGTGAHFLKNAGDKATDKLRSTLMKHGLRVRV